MLIPTCSLTTPWPSGLCGAAWPCSCSPSGPRGLSGWGGWRIYDPKTGKSPYCTDDPTVTEISYNHLSPVQGDSGKLLLVPAIGEQIMKRGGRSVAHSRKPRSAVTLTAHKATAVVCAWREHRRLQ